MNTPARLATLAAGLLLVLAGLHVPGINPARTGRLLPAPLLQVRPQPMSGACPDQWMAYLRDR